MSLAQKLYDLKSFRTQYEAVYILSVIDSIGLDEFKNKIDELLEKIDWNNILGIASVLSYSGESDHIEAALRIAQTCIIPSSKCEEIQKSAATIILSNLTNERTITLAKEKKFLEEDFARHYPNVFRLQTAGNKIANSVIVREKEIELNKFQKEVFSKYFENTAISISAPTSVGKSYILYLTVIQSLITKKQTIVYLVPTRALISQVESDLRGLIKEYEIPDTNITSIPLEEIEESNSNILVFTQERLHWYLVYNNKVEISCLIVDEAHKIEDGNRGILLQNKIEEIVESYKEIKLIFSSPFTSNPEIFFRITPSIEVKSSINSQFVTVNQNLIYMSQVRGDKKSWKIRVDLNKESYELDKIKLKRSATSKTEILALIVDKLSSRNPSNIIYANSPDQAEKIANYLLEIIEYESISEGIQNLIELIKSSVHKKYSLVDVLKKRIAFHYGNMPFHIKQIIEKLFKDGEIKYLVCTSTLLEGVNLPAKSIFIMNPQRGKGKPLEMNDFWNLAGRAGRWGKEFSGNIFCISPEGWEKPPESKKEQRQIVPALEKIEKDTKTFIDYLSENESKSQSLKKSELGPAFSYYYSKFLQTKLDPESKFYGEIKNKFNALKKQIEIPADILRKNPGISPIAQQQLFDSLKKHINDIEDYIPISPDRPEASAVYLKIFNLLSETITDSNPELNRYRVNLLIKWMEGKPLSRLISDSERYYKNKKSSKKLNAIIRETMRDVENVIRFAFARDANCFIDLLKFKLEGTIKADLIAKIPPLNLWIELGLYQKTQISFVSIGLSRNSAIELAQKTQNISMTKVECINWLKENLEELKLSPLIIDEIKSVL